MADPHSFKKLSLKRFPKVDKRENREDNFWKRFQYPLVAKEISAVSHIHFSPVAPHDFAITSGSRVQVYSGPSNQVKKTISRFNEAAFSACFRQDGKLLAAGTEEGVVKVFEMNSRAILRHFKGHNKPTKSVCFSVDGHKLISGSDDATVRVWDLTTEQCLVTLRGHEDYVHSLAPHPSTTDLLLSSSYDHTLFLWDLRTPSTPVLELDHGAPVEGVLLFPSGGTCVSAGDNYIKVWDILSGGRLLALFSNHQKTITSICFDGTGQRLLSGGLDKQLKVYSVEDYRVVQSISYPAPILSIGMSPSDSHLVVGMTTRLLSIKHARPKSHQSGQPTPALKGGTYRYFVRGRSYKPTPEEYVVAAPKRKKLQPYDKFLKKFQYKNALDAVLKHRGQGKTVMVYSLLQELVRRDGLTIALSGRNEEELYSILKYLSRHMTKPRFIPLLLDVGNMLIDIYCGMLSHSKTVLALFHVIKVKVDREVEFQKQAFQLLGTLDTILTATMATHRQQTAAASLVPLTNPTIEVSC
ncbi:U3 small nucleolar RNA-associated protein 15 homolog [Halichondria panicea]|uniref:U3 small nucleolar RNA-associated protein 15 homolog n=1 Tax=Halichondria panicea TaxID=6063 RepID=UPI00312B43E8